MKTVIFKSWRKLKIKPTSIFEERNLFSNMKKNIKEKNYCETSGRIITSVDKLRAGKNLAAGLATEPLTVDHLWYDQTGIQMVFFGVLCCTNKPLYTQRLMNTFIFVEHAARLMRRQLWK